MLRVFARSPLLMMLGVLVMLSACAPPHGHGGAPVVVAPKIVPAALPRYAAAIPALPLPH